MSGHYHSSECRDWALERIADSLDRIVGVLDEWAEANRTPRMVVVPSPSWKDDPTVAPLHSGDCNHPGLTCPYSVIP